MVDISSRQPDNINFLSPLGFKFVCQAMPETEYYCQSANIPGVAISEIQVPTPLNPHFVPGDVVTYETMDLRIIVDENMKNWLEIYEWVIGLGSPQTSDQYKKQHKKGITADGVLVILTGSNNPQLSLHFTNMWPMSISGLTFDINNSDVTYLTATVSFKYNYYTIKNLLNT